MRHIIGFFIVLWASSFIVAQTQEELNQAIQVVRNWVNKPQGEVDFVMTTDGSIDLYGPRRDADFHAPGYEVTVDLTTMTVVGWRRYLFHWVKNARTDLPLLNEDQIKSIAFNYAQRHFPHFNEFPNWEITLQKGKVEDLIFGTGKVAIHYLFDLHPFVTNPQGQKIPVLTTHCSVSVDPYTGEVIGFGYSHLPMTLTNLTPNFSPYEAKELVEQAFRDLGAVSAIAVMSSTEEMIFRDLPDGLVIGATQTSGLRLAYAFDYVVTVGMPGREDEFGTSDEPVFWRAAIDALTGELFHRERFLWIDGGKEKSILLKGLQRGQSKLRLFLESWQWRWGIGIIVLVMGCFFLLWARHRRRRLSVL